VIPFLEGYAQKNVSQVTTKAPPLFTTAKLWKQPRCPTTDEWIKKMSYLYTVEFYSVTKKNEIFFVFR
jgi:hypothetical protein